MTITLRAGDAELVLAPEIGGAIVAWTARGTHIFRPPMKQALETGFVRGLASYTLVPFSNRIAFGQFTFEKRHYTLPATFQGHAIHGVGWKSAWTAHDDGRRLTLDHAADDRWPFAFHAEQHFELTADGLRVRLSVTNTHDGPAPAGFGMHPFLPRHDGARLTFAADGVWFSGPDSLPMRKGAVPREWDFSAGPPVGGSQIDNCFTGWKRAARIDWATHALTITADDTFTSAVVFVPDYQTFFAVEPASHENGALNREGEMRVLAPGERLEGEIGFAVEWR